MVESIQTNTQNANCPRAHTLAMIHGLEQRGAIVEINQVVHQRRIGRSIAAVAVSAAHARVVNAHPHATVRKSQRLVVLVEVGLVRHAARKRKEHNATRRRTAARLEPIGGRKEIVPKRGVNVLATRNQKLAARARERDGNDVGRVPAPLDLMEENTRKANEKN